jgi:hypothetical protein
MAPHEIFLGLLHRLIPIPTHKRTMKSRLFPPGRVALVVNSEAIHSSCACSAHTGLQASAAAPASSVLLEFPATPLPDEKIHRFHLVRYGLGLVLGVVQIT